MLVGEGEENPPALRPLALASARMYPEFVHQIEDESGNKVDLRSEGTLLIGTEECDQRTSSNTLSETPLRGLEPELARSSAAVVRIEERSVDPRALTAAVLKACLHRGVVVSSSEQVVSVNLSDTRVSGVTTAKQSYAAPLAVNCAGAWSGQFPPYKFPTRPVKGQMLAVVSKRN